MPRFLIILALLFALHGQPPCAVAATGDPVSASVLLTGREIDLTFSGLGTGGNYVTGLSGPRHCLTGTEKCRVLVTSPSYNSDGTTTTTPRVLIGQWPRRKPYPDHATNQESFSGGNFTGRMVLSDYVYAGESVSVDLGTGLYTYSGTPTNAVNGMAATNNSGAAYQPIGAYWTMVSRVLVHNTFTLSCVAFHRHWGLYRPVRCVKFTVTDQHDHTVTVFSEDLSKTWNAGEQKPTQEYTASIPVTSFTENDTLTCQATVYPWVGNNPLTTVGGTAEPYAGFGPRTFLLDKNNDYGVTCALVDAVNGVDPGSPDAAKVYDETAFNPATAWVFQTRGRAYASAVAYNQLIRGRNDGGAAKIYSKAGSYANMGSTNSYGNQPAVRPEFLPAAGLSAADVIINGNSGTANIGSLMTETATITSAAAGTYGGVTDLWLKDAVINTSNTQLFITANSVVSMTGGRVPLLGQGLQGTSTVNCAFGLLRGVDLSGFGNTIRPFCMIGCAGTSCGNLRIVDQSTGQSAPLLAPVFAYNEFLGITNATGADVMKFGVLSNSVPGFFDVGNCIETITGPGAGGIITLYTGEMHYTGGVRLCGTCVGGREFDRYNDGQSPANVSDTWTREFGVDAFFYRDRPATKMDLLPPQDGGRQGAAAPLFGTSYFCNYYCQNMWSLTGRSFYKEYAGIGSWQPSATDTPDYGGTEALFTRRLASIVRSPSDPGNGTGNGSYIPQPNSPLVGMPEASGILCPIRWDLKGDDRAILNAVGAYVPLREPKRAARVRSLN
jgi:hypothetical protein